MIKWTFCLARDVLLPKFDIPSEYQVTDDPDGKKGKTTTSAIWPMKGKQRYAV